jgi:hypothetical protein
MKRSTLIIGALGLVLFAQAAQADWTAAKRLTWTGGASWYPAVAAFPPGDIYVVWCDETPGNREIFFKRSTDGGASWSANKRLTWTSGSSNSPAIAVNGTGNLYIVWYDNTSGNMEIYFKESTDGGASWSANKRLTWNSGGSYHPALAAESSDRLHLVWDDETSGSEIYYKTSTDDGVTWSANKRFTWTAGASYSPAVAVDSSGRIYVVWYEGVIGGADIFFKKSTGVYWSANKRISWSKGSAKPAIAVNSSGHLHVVWHDDAPGNREIYYKKSINLGEDWSTAQRLTQTSGSSMDPVIAVDSSGYLHVVWQDDTSGIAEIYHRKSTDNGDTWSTVQRLTWNSGSSMFPAISADMSGNVHVVWSDNTPGNVEVYYKKYTK